MKPAASLRIDFVFLFVVIILLTIGLIMIFSTSSVVGFSHYSDSYFYVKRHLLYITLGAIALSIGLAIPHQLYKKYAFAGYMGSIGLLLLTLIPGVQCIIGGASRWIQVAGFHLQPVEVAKFFVVVFLATSIANKKETLTHLKRGFLPVLLGIGVPLFILAKQPDLGNIVLLLMTILMIFFVSKIRIAHVLGLVGLGIFAVIVNILSHPYQMDRVKTFLFPWSDPMGKTYHIVQSFIAVGSGGLFGLGLGQSKLKYFYLPLHYSDFIFSIICEEGGFIIATITIILIGLLFYRGMVIAFKTNDLFSRYLAFGLTLLLVLQAFLNIGVTIGVFPVTGIPLTFISFGGTSLIMSLFFVGVILNVSKTKAVSPQDSELIG